MVETYKNFNPEVNDSFFGWINSQIANKAGNVYNREYKVEQRTQDIDARTEEGAPAIQVEADITTEQEFIDQIGLTEKQGERYSKLRRKLGLKNEDEWTGKGVSYCSTCDAPLYKNKNLAIVVGGGNAAVEGAILIAKYAKKVFLVYRGEKLWRPEPILLETLNKTENVDVLLNNNVTELIGSDFGGLQKIKLEKEHNNETEYTVDGLMIEAGADPRVEIPNSLGIDLDIETNEVVVDKDQKTNIDGIYAAGDLTNGSNLKQTITAASQGAISALSAYNYCLENKN